MEETPTIWLNAVVWEAFAEAIRGVLPPAIDKKEVDAELKASKYHLEDMRKLLKLLWKLKPVILVDILMKDCATIWWFAQEKFVIFITNLP